MGSGKIKRKAIFLDRDGVLNHNVYYPDTKEWESPRDFTQFKIIDGAINSLKKLQDAGFLLFIVTNQPSYAKGKTSLENLKEIITEFDKILKNNNITISKLYSSFNHPQSIYPEYRKSCNYRKPGTQSLMDAKQDYDLDMNNSWMVGDRETDIICGNNSEVKTIFISPDYEEKLITCKKSNFNAANIIQAVDIILSRNEDVKRSVFK